MQYDLIIIGAGPAGMTAALYAGRSGLKALVIEKLFPGGQAATTFWVDNYPGFENGVSGGELMYKFEAQAKRFGAEFITGEVTALELDGDIKKVKLANAEHTAKAVILAMGASRRQLGLSRERELIGSGVSYCATCDGAFFKGKEVAVVGGGDAATEDALVLARTCSKVYLIHRRDTLRATKVLQQAVMDNKNIEIVWNSVIKDINGENKIDSLALENIQTNQASTQNVSGLFIAIGSIPDTAIAAPHLKLDENGYIITNPDMSTAIPGVYAAGDVCQKPLHQIITAASDGANAVYQATKYINEKG